MRDFQEFINKDIIINFDGDEDFSDFHEICLKNKIDCLDTFTTYKEASMREGIYYSKRYKELLINYSDDTGYEKLKASDFLKPQTTIEIFQSKQTVVCLKKQDGKVVAVGKAKCNPDDEFDFDYGSTLAFKRMLVDSKNKELKAR